jgi:hypothetical protein
MRSMTEAVGHLLGHGRRRPWHLFTLLWIVPVALAIKWTLDLEPGKGPQGGEAIVLFLLVAMLGIAGCAVVNALRLYRGAPRTGAIGWLRRLIVVLGAVLAGLVAFWMMLDKATSMVTADGFDPVGWAGVFAVVAGFFLFNAWALVRSCARADRAA